MGFFDKVLSGIRGGDDSDEPADTGSRWMCISCQQSMEGSEMTSEWEDGDNASAYITCRHCGAENLF